MTGAYRLPPANGELIDRSSSVRFRFEDQEYQGFAGDTVASALAAHGVAMLSRSFKYHRPRGFQSLAGCEANTLVTVNGVPNVAAETHVVSDGDQVRAQNYAGSLAFDRYAWLGLFGRFLPVGFYYRAFFRPKSAWRFWEPHIRRMAGLGRVDLTAQHRYYDKAYMFAETVVVGGGAAGLAAAIEAADHGGRVILVEADPFLGGALNHARYDAEGIRGRQVRAALLARLEGRANVTMLTGATCQGLFADHWLAVVRGNRLYKIRAGRVVLATGAREQPAVFHNNDLPGIVLGSAAQRLIRRYGVRPGLRAVVLTANDEGYGVALDLIEAGVQVAAVLDLRRSATGGQRHAALAQHKLRIEEGCGIAEAFGRRRVRRVRAARLLPDGGLAPFDTIECDLVCMSVGFAPDLALAAHAGARLAYDARTAMQRAEGLPDGVTVAGAANQVFALDLAIADGSRAGRNSSDGIVDETASAVTHPAPLFPHPKGKEFVDFDEDLTVRDIEDTIASGFEDVQLLKRYSTAGMGPSQGRHSNVNTLRIAARARGRPVNEIGTTTLRPPYSGESFGVLAGRSFEPVRRTAIHHRHIEAGAQMMPAGAWLRPALYGEPGNDQAVAAEVAAVRNKAGMIDVSTLGKIEIRGPDAAELINRIYYTGHLKQPVGRARYGLMTDAAGTIADDGVVCRLGEQHFFVTATTTGVEAVVRSMYLWNARWRLDVDIAHVTAAYAAVNLAGPDSRAILAQVCKDVDLGATAFPYMHVREGHVAGVPARILRVGFVGELGYEIHIPSGCGEFVWDSLLQAGGAAGLRPFGVEAQRVLRLEKGHIIVGQDTDGLTNLLEIGMAKAPPSKAFFAGHAALAAHRESGIRRTLVGFTVDEPGPLPKECHLVIEAGEIAGRVTSCVRSAAVGRIIGLAYVPPDQADAGRSFTIRVDGGRMLEAKVASLPFYDPGNERQKS